MAGYTITITPNDDEAGARTTIRVDTTSGSARITELTVRATAGGAIFPQQLPALNLDQLIAALVPPAPAAVTATPGPNGHGSTQVDVSGLAAEVSEAQVAEEVPEASEASVSSVRTGRSSRPKKTARAAPAKKAPSRTRQPKADRAAAAAAAAAAAQPANGRRAYRRMPEPGEVLSAYREVGGTTALARHYGVPRHTATGWLRRLRNLGLLES
ncbi:hypothetical protein HC028_25290 [Planosporangium flavigriseum]|uniref:Uncharacterized protein n=1 Tax=Planosporangium flavigriseum TaxID=373681 RepID=A0A8J3LSJ8_9ACTN|nr:hypothetical protein [Planosporangium flavigriseum]NJC67793.1 hypothetical protein [Planosporangium flavigriseum]GIG76040.1 hypothetical protein Pfl04_44440 [Planosporangium flavigriseum]